jgi:hypothetical protein
MSKLFITRPPKNENESIEGDLYRLSILNNTPYNYQNDLMVVMYIEGRMQSIAYQLDTQNKSMKEKDALEFAKRVMPVDATFVKKIDKDDMERIYVYHSKLLEGLFSDDWFKDGDGNVQPGELSLNLAHDGDRVDSLSAAIGGN